MRRLTFIQLAVAGLLLAGVLGAYALWYAAVGKLSVEAAALAEAIQTKSQESARVAAARVALASLSEDEAAMRAYLVREQDIVSFLGALEDTGTSLGASVEVVSVGADVKDERGRLVLSLKIAGTFDAVQRTLGAFEYGPYDSAIQSVTFDTVRTEAGNTGWTAVATFTLGTQKAP